MAQLNITLDQNDVLHLLKNDTSEAFKALLEQTLNSVLRAESSEQICAEPYERTQERRDSRNGMRSRPLTTRIGTIELSVPRHRNVPFKTLVFENYKRSEAALVTTMAEMVVAGVSTAKVGRVMEALCGRSFSKQTVSEACKELDAAVGAFCGRPLDGDILFVMVDATYLKAREDHRIVSKALMVAVGLDAQGRKEVLGFRVADAETAQSWRAFLLSLRERGLRDFKMLTSDAHEGIVSAFQEVYPHIAWQRCQAHFARNIADAAPRHLRCGLKSELIEMFNCRTLADARHRRDEIIADYGDVAPKACECLDAGFDDAMTVMELPVGMRRCTRTSNYIERLNKEVKRRSNVIGIFPNADSVTRLAGAFLIEENERWRAAAKIYYKPSIEELEKKTARLIQIANIQRELQKVA